jgi:transcription antitermination factor NusG
LKRGKNRTGTGFDSELATLRNRNNKFWMVLKTKQASSSDAIENARKQGFEVFHPQYRLRPVRGIRKIVALFPFYLLVNVDETINDWKVLASTRGVERILMNSDNEPGYVSDQAIADIRTLTDDSHDGYYHDPNHEPPVFAKDAVVMGKRGLFVGKHGIYKGLAGTRGDRVRVLFTLLGKTSHFELNAYDLVAA